MDNPLSSQTNFPLQILLWASAVLFALAVSGMAAEFAVRLAQPELDPARHVRFEKAQNGLPTLGPRNTEQRQIKNTGDFDVAVYFNKYGFRDTKDLATSAPGDYFVVGDSLSFGWGVEEAQRYSNLVQAELKRNVFNLCIPGDIDDFEKVIAYAEKNGAKIDRLLLAISMAFNLKNYEKKAEKKAAPIRAEGLMAPLKQYLMTHSASYFLVTSFVHRNETLKKKAIELGLIRPNIEGIAYKAFSAEIIESTARRTARLARKYDTTIVIAHSRALWIGTDEEKKTADRIHRTFVTRLEELGLDVADVRPAFEASGNPIENYFANDGHWGPKGHRAAAAAIIDHIKARGPAAGKAN